MRTWAVTVTLAALGVASCSDDGPTGLPLVTTTVTGSYAGNAFTPAFGFVTVYQGANLIAVGDGPLDCASPALPDPPAGTNAAFTVPALEPGTYGNVFVNLYRNVGGFTGHGSNAGTVTLTAVTAAAVTGSISYSDTDDVGAVYTLSGDFEITRCP